MIDPHAHAIILDFEATCSDTGRVDPQEVIEFPSVLLDLATGEVVDEFASFVRPVHHPQLSSFCRELTTITQADVDAAPPFAEVFAAHQAWLDGHGLTPQNALMVTCGDWDLGSMLPRQCRVMALGAAAGAGGVDEPGGADGPGGAGGADGASEPGVPAGPGGADKAGAPAASGEPAAPPVPAERPAPASPPVPFIPPLYRRWLNLKVLFNEVTGRKRAGMVTMLRVLDLPLVGTHHRGLADCRNLAAILRVLVARGGLVRATGELTVGE